MSRKFWLGFWVYVALLTLLCLGLSDAWSGTGTPAQPPSHPNYPWSFCVQCH